MKWTVIWPVIYLLMGIHVILTVYVLNLLKLGTQKWLKYQGTDKQAA